MLLKPLSKIMLSLGVAALIFGCSGEANDSKPKSNIQESTSNSSASPAAIVSTPKAAVVNRSIAVDYPAASRTMVDGLTSAIVEVTGKVVFINGAPASSATVQLMNHSPGIERSVSLASTSTDATGNFHVRGEDQRELALRVSGDFPSAYVQLLTKSTHYSGQPGIRRLELDITIPEPQSLTGNVLDATGKELDGVAVHLLPSFKRTPAENVTDHRPREILQTTTTASGDFLFDHLSKGDWILGARIDGFAPVTVPVSLPTSEPAVLRFTAKGGTVSGRIVHLVSGDPLSEIPVFLGPGDMNQLPGIESQQTTSSADGTFAFENLSTGPLRVYTNSGDKGLYMALPRPGNISLSDGETTDVEILVYPGHTIYGTVTDRDTKDPVAGVTMKARTAIQNKEVTTTTDEQGNYRLEGIVPYSSLETWVEAEHDRYSTAEEAPGRMNMPTHVQLSLDGSPVQANLSMIQNITISGEVVTEDDVPVAHAQVRYMGFSRIDAAPVPVDNAGKFTVYAPPFSDGGIEATAKGFAMIVKGPINVANQPIENVKVVMKPGASVLGTVTDNNSNPIEGAVVQLSREYGNISYGAPSVVTAADGTFHFTDLSENVKLSARKEGYDERTAVDLELQPGEVRKGIVLILEKQGTGIISGTVVKADGPPAKGVWVSVEPRGYRSAVSREDGTFVLTGLEEGTSYDLRVRTPQDRIIHSVKTGTTDLKIVMEAPPAPRPPHGSYTLEGTVVDDITGEPVKDFKITETRAYEIEKQPEPGTFKLSINAGTRLPIQISSPEHEEQLFYSESGKVGETVKQTFRLGKPGAISGRLIEERNGEPLANVSVLNMGTAPPWGRRRHDEVPKSDTVTDADGKFTLANVPNGMNQLIFMLPDPYAPLTMEVEVKSAEATDLGDVKAGTGGDIFGTVVRGPQREPVEGLQVVVRAVTGDVEFEKTFITDSEGKFEVVGLQDAGYEIKAGNVRLRTEVKDANVADVLVQLGKVKVTGTVKTGAEPYRGWVQFQSPEVEFMVLAEQGGSYVLENVIPGNYTVVVSTSSGVSHREDVTVPDEPEFNKDIIIPNGRIRVILSDEAGKPVPGVTIELEGDALSSTGRYSTRSEKTNPEGIYVFTNLKPGTYTVTVNARTQRGQGIQEVQVQDGETRDVKVQTRELPPQ